MADHAAYLVHNDSMGATPLVPLVVTQPFQWTSTASQDVFTSIKAKHYTGKTIQGKVQALASSLHRDTVSQFTSTLRELDYEAFLAGLLSEDEVPVLPSARKFIEYTRVLFRDARTGLVFEETRSGRCLLTNRRILLLSSTSDAGNSLSVFGDPKKLPGGYRMASNMEDRREYHPIALKSFLAIRMSVNVGVQSQQDLTGESPKCGGYCPCFCPKSWVPDPPTVSVVVLCDARGLG